jgi:GH24 family phage-related lysozyme (muramidase)
MTAPNSIQPTPTETSGGIGKRVLVALLSLSAAGFATWQVNEGYTPVAVIPTKGDVPTIGHGSTRYEDGRRVKMGDRIDRRRAAELARNLIGEDEKQFAATLPGVTMTQAEYDVYLDFVGQYGIGNWRRSSMRRNLLVGNYAAACKSLLKYRFAANYDCSTRINGKPNKRCWGVWTRQQDRHNKCMAAL